MASKTDNYVFTRDMLDNSRLNLFHHLWTKSFGYVIHPSIPVDKENLRVADIGTGTGIWLLDVHDKLPKSAQLYGMDISFDATPPIETLPSNITLRHLNVKDPIPEDLVGVFDIIHIRFFVFVLLEEEVPSMVEKLSKLLKPGGYLQWVEPNNQTIRVETTKPENKTENILALMNRTKSQDPRLNPTWAPGLGKIFSDSGLVDVEVDAHDSPPHLAFLMHECGLIMHELIARKTQNEQVAEELKQLLPRVIHETREGAYITVVRFTVIGKKLG
ncbi:UMTA methyltransferase family protein [Biscogniauxia marginata]|nr:UMTA methyltransferase family protein [Biscogniauxia marginata]